jgi:hypothetical protein
MDQWSWQSQSLLNCLELSYPSTSQSGCCRSNAWAMSWLKGGVTKRIQQSLNRRKIAQSGHPEWDPCFVRKLGQQLSRKIDSRLCISGSSCRHGRLPFQQLRRQIPSPGTFFIVFVINN